MTILWLIFWLLSNTPPLHEWNNWLIALIICGFIDVFEVS